MVRIHVNEKMVESDEIVQVLQKACDEAWLLMLCRTIVPPPSPDSPRTRAFLTTIKN